MQVKLNLKNDAELRAYIKDLIKGQVLTIVREDFLEIIKQEINRKIQAEKPGSFERLLKQSAVLAVRDLLWSKHNVSKWNDEFIKPIVEAQVAEAIKGRNLDAVINDMFKDKLIELLDKIQ